MNISYCTPDSQSTICFPTPVDFTISALESAALRTGPRVLLGRIVLWAGKKGACWRSVSTMAATLGVCERTIQRWKRTLITAGFLAEYPRHGSSPFLVPYPRPLEGRQNQSDTGAPGGQWGDISVIQKDHEAQELNVTAVAVPPSGVDPPQFGEPHEMTNVVDPSFP